MAARRRKDVVNVGVMTNRYLGHIIWPHPTATHFESRAVILHALTEGLS
jgi:hypothetical protein